MVRQIILLCLDSTALTDGRFEFAARLAKENNAHLRGIAHTEVFLKNISVHEVGENNPALLARLKMHNRRAEDLVQAFQKVAQQAQLDSFEGLIVDGELTDSIVAVGRLADLIIVRRGNFAGFSAAEDAHFPENLMLESGCPILIVPPGLIDDEMHCQNVAIAWDASRVAARAVKDALPILKRAKRVCALMFNVETDFKGSTINPGQNLKDYLKYHGVELELVEPQKAKNVGEALLSYSLSHHIDLIVQGGYFHSRFREFFLGGVTRTVLMESTVPILMSH